MDGVWYNSLSTDAQVYPACEQRWEAVWGVPGLRQSVIQRRTKPFDFISWLSGVFCGSDGDWPMCQLYNSWRKTVMALAIDYWSDMGILQPFLKRARCTNRRWEQKEPAHASIPGSLQREELLQHAGKHKDNTHSLPELQAWVNIDFHGQVSVKSMNVFLKGKRQVANTTYGSYCSLLPLNTEVS